MGTKELQKEIKIMLGKLKWSQKKLGREFYYAKHEFEDDLTEINRYEEKAKKDLSRNTTKPEILQSYLNLISQHNEFKGLDIIIPPYTKSGALSDEMERGMQRISKLITNLAI
jgi:hypothetical protein